MSSRNLMHIFSKRKSCGDTFKLKPENVREQAPSYLKFVIQTLSHPINIFALWDLSIYGCLRFLPSGVGQYPQRLGTSTKLSEICHTDASRPIKFFCSLSRIGIWLLTTKTIIAQGWRTLTRKPLQLFLERRMPLINLGYMYFFFSTLRSFNNE